MGVRTEAIPLLSLWSDVLDVLEPKVKPSGHRGQPADSPAHSPNLQTSWPRTLKPDTMVSIDTIDYMPPGMPQPSERAKCYIFEDNDAVLKMVRRGRTNTMPE